MKKIYTLLTGVLFCCSVFAQTFSPDFLDGKIQLKLKQVDETVAFSQAGPRDENILSKEETLANYPTLASVLKDVQVTKFERPAYYTEKPDLQKLFRISFSNFQDIDEIIARLQQLDIVEYAEKMPIYKTSYIPNDTYYSGTNKWYHDLVGSHLAWDISKGRNQVKIAIVDNAVHAKHLDLTYYKQYDVADNDTNATPPKDYNTDGGWSHGTHCAGLATADINNARGIASLGAAVELIGIKCTPDNATTSTSIYYSYDGVMWACKNGAHIVSMSYGGASFSQAYQDLINAYPAVTFFAAAGNDNSSAIQYPAYYNNVICVGSVDGNDSRSSFSNYNGSTTWVDIASPGGYTNGGLLSTVYTASGNSYAKMGGTSMATPFAAGLAGLMLSVHPALTPAQILNCLVSTGKAINQNIGPRIDALKAMQCVQNMLTGAPIANFFADRQNIFVGDSVIFTDNSVGGGNNITSWAWTFTGGSPGTYNGQTPPPIFYNTAGSYQVQLTVTNSQTNDVETKTAYIVVTLEPFGQWIVQNTKFAAASRGIRYISIVNKDVVWACAYDGAGTNKNVQEFTRTTDGGTTWTPGTINIGDTSLGIAMIHAFDAQRAWIVAYPNSVAGKLGGIWRTIDGGATWQKQTTALFNNAASFSNVIYFWGKDTGFCMGDPISGEYEIYTTVNGGTNWTAVSGTNIANPLSGEFGYVGGIETFGNNVWFTTNKGRLYFSSDRGRTFNAAYQSPIADFAGATVGGHVSFKSAAEGMIVDNTGKVYKTTNSGSTWTPVTTTGSVFSAGLCWIQGTEVIFSTGSGGTLGSGSSFSQDGGVSWNIIDTQQHLYVDFLDLQTGWSGWFNTDATTNGMWKWKNTQNPMIPDFSADKITVCVGGTVNFTDLTTGTTPASYSWTFQGGTPGTSTAQNPSIVYNAVGTYDVTLTTNDGSGGTATKNKIGYIEVVAAAAAPGAITGLADPCVGASETYFVPNVSGVTYNWTLPSGWTGTSNTNSITVTVGANSGNISVTATNACGTSTATTLAVAPTTTPAPTANYTFTIIGDSVKFTSTSTSATSWYWDFKDGFSSNVENPGHKYTANGTYYVMLIATNKCGSDTIIDTVIITSVGIRELAATPVQLYPNPVSSSLYIDLASGVENYKGEIRILDVTGRIINRILVDGKHFEINTINLEAGVYFVEMKETNQVFRFMKE